MDVTNAHDYRTSLIQIVKDIKTFPKQMDVEYTSFQEEHKNALTKAKQEVPFLIAIQENKKENMSAKK